MARIPSSQTKAKQISLQQAIIAAQRSSTHLHLTMYGKVLELRKTKSDDKVQQLQTEIISDLYDAVRTLQVMMDPLLLTLPNLTATRDGDGYGQ